MARIFDANLLDSERSLKQHKETISSGYHGNSGRAQILLLAEEEPNDILKTGSNNKEYVNQELLKRSLMVKMILY